MSCLPEPHVPAHINGDHSSRFQSSHHHISLWHFAQPVGVWWYRIWPTNHQEIIESVKKKKMKLFTKLNSFIAWLCVACSPWDRDIFDLFEVQINYLQVPCRHWRCDIWRPNQRTNQQNEDKVTSDMLSVLLCKALTLGVDIFKGHLAWWKSTDDLIGWKQTGAVLASGWGGTQTSSKEHVWPTLIAL